MTRAKCHDLQILVVDDQPDVCRSLRDLLTALGHLVVTVPGPSEALGELKARNIQFDCMITDVELPIMSGAVLAERAMELEPGLRVVLMSGYPRELLASEGHLRPGQAFLPKPFRGDQLQRVLDVVREWRSARAWLAKMLSEPSPAAVASA